MFNAEDLPEYLTTVTTEDRPGFYGNLEKVRRAGLEADIPYMIIVQLSEDYGIPYLMREDISYEAWQTLAYGCTVLSYFTYWTPVLSDNTYVNALLTETGERCLHYYDVQAVNAAIRPIGECIAQTRSEAVIHVGEEGEDDPVMMFEGYAGIRSISGGRYAVGFFEDGTFIIANKDRQNGSACTVETDAALEIFDVETETFVSVTEKTFDIPAGGGVYLRFAGR